MSLLQRGAHGRWWLGFMRRDLEQLASPFAPWGLGRYGIEPGRHSSLSHAVPPPTSIAKQSTRQPWAERELSSSSSSSSTVSSEPAADPETSSSAATQSPPSSSPSGAAGPAGAALSVTSKQNLIWSSQTPTSELLSSLFRPSAKAAAAIAATGAAAGCLGTSLLAGDVAAASLAATSTAASVLACSLWASGRHDWFRNLGGPSSLPVATMGLLGANACVFLMQQLDPMITYHMAEIPYKVMNGEWWRLLTPVFLHASIPHWLLNSWALYSLGSTLEPMWGRKRFMTVYMGAAVLGNAAACFMTANSHHIAMGSSTALYGLFGGYVLQLLTTHGIRGAHATGELQNIMVTVGINVLLTMYIPGLSIWGHAGGFAGGALLAHTTRRWYNQRWRY